MSDLAKRVAEVIWTTSRADEGTISAMGADIIADALLPLIREREAAAWDEGYGAAEHMARCWGHTDWWEDEPSNPHTEAADEDRVTT